MMLRGLLLVIVVFVVSWGAMTVYQQNQREDYQLRLNLLKQRVELFGFNELHSPADIFEPYQKGQAEWWCDYRTLENLAGRGYCDYQFDGEHYTLSVGDYHYWLVYDSSTKATRVKDKPDFVLGPKKQQVIPCLLSLLMAVSLVIWHVTKHYRNGYVRKQSA